METKTTQLSNKLVDLYVQEMTEKFQKTTEFLSDALIEIYDREILQQGLTPGSLRTILANTLLIRGLLSEAIKNGSLEFEMSNGSERVTIHMTASKIPPDQMTESGMDVRVGAHLVFQSLTKKAQT